MNKSLLPRHRSDVEHVTEAYMGKRLESLNYELINTDPDECDPKILHILAKTAGINIEGLEIEAARKFVKNSFMANNYKGTVLAVKQAIRSIYPGIDDYPGYLEDNIEGEPFMFRVHVPLEPSEVLDKKLLDLINVVEQAKNVRSELKSVELAPIGKSADIKISSGVSISTSFHVEPEFVFESKITESKGLIFKI